MTKIKAALGLVVGGLMFVSQLGLPAPWGPLVTSLLGVAAFFADHSKVAAALAGKAK